MRLVLKVPRYRTVDGRNLVRGDEFDAPKDLAEHYKRTGKAADAPPPKPQVYRTRRMKAED